MTNTGLAIAVIVFAGSLAALQAPMNAALGRGLGSGTAAATISFGIGFLALLAYTVAMGHHMSLTRLSDINPWLLLGGLMGAFYVWAILWAVPTLGVLTAVSGMILGQLVIAMVLDHGGHLGLDVREVSPTRLLAVFLVGGGLILSKL